MGDERDRGRYPRAQTPPSVQRQVERFEEEDTGVQRVHLYHEVAALRADHQSMRNDLADTNRKIDANHRELGDHVGRLRVETGQQTVQLSFLVESAKTREAAGLMTGEGHAMRRSNWAIAFLSLAGVIIAAMIAAVVAFALAPKS